MSQNNNVVDFNFDKRQRLESFLVNRFYYIKSTGGQKVFFDSVSNDWTLTTQHLVSQLLQRGANYGEAQQLLKHTVFKPIINKPLYRPHDSVVCCQHGNYYPNLWRKPLIQPDSSLDSSPFVKHLTLMLGSEEKADYLLQLLAYKYQNKQSKLHVACYFYGREGGMGKSLVSQTLQQTFGESAVKSVSDQSSLTSKSQVELWMRSWLVINEADVKIGSSLYNTIKSYTGEERVDADRKHRDFESVDIPANLIMLSNHAPTFIEENDRRFFVSEWQHKFESAQEKSNYFDNYTDWLFNQNGLAAIADLLNSLEVTVKRTEAAMMTPEKERTMLSAQHPVIDDIKIILECNSDRKLYMLDSFRDVFKQHNINDTKRWAHILAECGITKASPVRSSVNGKRQRYTYYQAHDWQLMQRTGVKPVLVKNGETVQACDDEGWANESQVYAASPCEL